MSQPDKISTDDSLVPTTEDILQRIFDEQCREATELLVELEADFVLVEIVTRSVPPTDEHEHLYLKARCLASEYIIVLRLLSLARKHAAQLGDARFTGSRERVMALQRVTRFTNAETHLRLAAAGAGVFVEQLQSEFL
jgi:hypothetical protein